MQEINSSDWHDLIESLRAAERAFEARDTAATPASTGKDQVNSDALSVDDALQGVAVAVKSLSCSPLQPRAQPIKPGVPPMLVVAMRDYYIAAAEFLEIPDDKVTEEDWDELFIKLRKMQDEFEVANNNSPGQLGSNTDKEPAEADQAKKDVDMKTKMGNRAKAAKLTPEALQERINEIQRQLQQSRLDHPEGSDEAEDSGSEEEERSEA